MEAAKGSVLLPSSTKSAWALSRAGHVARSPCSRRRRRAGPLAPGSLVNLLEGYDHAESTLSDFVNPFASTTASTTASQVRSEIEVLPMPFGRSPINGRDESPVTTT